MTEEGPDVNGSRSVVLLAVEPAGQGDLQAILGERFEILTAGSEDQVLELLDEHPELAVIIASHRFGAARGSDLLTRARRSRPHAARILSSSEVELSILMEAVNDAGVVQLIRPPYQDDLLGIVSALAADADDRRRLAASQATLERDHNEGTRREHELQRQLDEARRHLRRSGEELAQLTRELEVLSYCDPLTGLYNHRAFQERLREEMARARRYEQPLSLVLIDVDNFGVINSRLGYQIGDETLRRLATEVVGYRAAVGNRRSDIASRFAGELFALALPETSLQGAMVKAERMRELVADLPALGDIELTVSIGVASFPGDGADADELLSSSRRALRRAKKDGRNKVVAAADRHGPDDDEDESTEPPAARPVLGSGPPMFPSYHQRLAEIVAALERDQAVAALYVDLSPLRRVEQEYGLSRHAALFARAGTLLHGLQGSRLRKDDLICRTEVDDAYICILSPARHRSPSAPLDLGAIARRVESVLDEAMGEEIASLASERPRISVGYARVLNNPLMRPERLIARLIEESRHSAAMLRERTLHRDKAVLQELILHRQLRSVYQPIVHLESGDTFGFESLTRGPVDTRLEMPTELFAVADEVDLTFELDRACFRGALRNAAALEPVHRLFLNILPLSFYDARFIEEEVSRLVEEANLTPANLVFEITERLAIENFSAFRRALARYTAMGFGVAIDDVGTRHSNLETVMALRPHFIKISDILTKGVSSSTVKREMLRSLGRIAEAIDAVIVAEGIETADDLAVLVDLGVRYGQGFFLARPGPPFPVVSADVKDTVRALAKGRRSPIPEPTPDFDEDGDYREGTTPDVHAAVVQRIHDVPGHEAAKSMLNRLEKLREGETERGSSPQWAQGTLAPTKRDLPGRPPAPPDPDDDGPDTGMHRLHGQFLEWTPIREEDLGGDSSQPSGSSLLDSLRTGRAPSTDKRGTDPDADGDA